MGGKCWDLTFHRVVFRQFGLDLFCRLQVPNPEINFPSNMCTYSSNHLQPGGGLSTVRTPRRVVHTGFSCWFTSFCHSFSFFHFLSNCFSVISTFFSPVCLYLSVNFLPLKSQKDNYKGIMKWEVPFEYTDIHLSLSLLYVPEQQYSAVKA